MRNIFVATLLAGSALTGTAFAQDNNNENANSTADVVVQPDAPAVKVDVPEPDVQVNQADPNVSVSQPQPTITVNQPAPTISVDIPQPTITVRMPDPNVDVEMAQPEVSVSQGEPRVSVDDSGNAAVETSDDGDEQANVTVDQANANVQVRQSDQRPQIRYQSEDAKVSVNQEKGEPKIIYQNADGSPMDGSEDTATDRQQQGNAASQDRQERVTAEDAAGERSATDNETMAINPGSSSEREMTVEEVTDYDIIGANGEVLGDIQEIVKVDNRLFAVIGSGGFLGLGEKEVAIPLSSLMATDRGMIAPNVTESQIDALSEFDDDQYPELEDETRITVGQQ